MWVKFLLQILPFLSNDFFFFWLCPLHTEVLRPRIKHEPPRELHAHMIFKICWSYKHLLSNLRIYISSAVKQWFSTWAAQTCGEGLLSLLGGGQVLPKTHGAGHALRKE